MQAQDSFSVQRRPLDIEDYIDIARRHKAWIFGPVFASLVVSVVGAFLWPDTYVSTATIKVNPQQVPEAYVQSNVNQLISDRIAAIAQTVLSRPVLTSIITTYDLYQRERQNQPMENLVEKMRSDIRIGNVLSVASAREHVPAFQISFAYTDRKKAQQVVGDLLAKFIDTNVRDRNSSSLNTTNLLKDERDGAKKELDQAEDRLAQYRIRNQGRLPDQMQTNLQQMQTLQTRLSTINAALGRLNQDKLMMETQMRIYKDQLSNLTKEPPPAEVAAFKSDRLIEAEREVTGLERQLATLRDHYKETFPDVQRVAGMLNAAKNKRDQIAKEDEANKPKLVAARPPNPQNVREARDVEASIRRLESLIEAKDLEAEDYKKELAQANAQVKVYQARMDETPMSEKEYMEILRDRDSAKMKLADLDTKVNRATLAQQMEDRKAGENLEQLDPPSQPMTPTQPKRHIIVGVGTVVGLLIGIVFAGAREMKDTSLKNLKDVRAYTQLPILGSVPLLENDLVVKRRKRFSWFAWSLACLAGIAVMSGSIVYYYATK